MRHLVTTRACLNASECARAERQGTRATGLCRAGLAPQAGRRRGAVLGMALVCLLVVAGLGALVLRASLVEHHRSLLRERQLQTLWLAESGLDRALAALAASPDYRGESWRITSGELGGRDAATVRIAIEPIEGNAERGRITVEASCSDDPQRRIVQRRITEIELPKTGEPS